MKKQLQLLLPAVLFCGVLVTLLLTVYYGAMQEEAGVTPVESAALSFGGETREVSLPVVLQDVPHGSEVTVSFSLNPKEGDVLFFGSVYAPLTIEANGEVLYTYGAPGTYPPFFGDPPTQYDSVSLPAGKTVKIDMRYRSPRERTSLSIHAPEVGSGSAVLHDLLGKYGLSMTVALLFLFLGGVLMIMSAFFLRMENSSRLFMLPGLLCFFAGAWQFGENTFSVFLLQRPSLLYAMDFLGLFLLVIPLYRMGLVYINPKSQRLLRAILYWLEISAVVAIVLQLTGTVSFHRSLYYFHVLLPLALLVLPACALYEYIRRRNRTAGLFFVPFSILAVSAVLELINYRVRFMPQYSTVFQVGLFLFVFAMAAFSGISARNIYALRIRNLTLENEIKLQEQTIAAQKQRNELLLSHYEEIRRQRHDIRHHLRALNDMLRRGDTENAAAYIRSVSESVPSYTPERYCENVILNATLSYYAQQIQEEGIRLEIRAQIPRDNPNISDANLCVIFGNLLENALEACRRMKSGSRYIELNAQVRGESLFITMDNSYDGSVHTDGERFYSSKRAGFGTGLRSVQSLAETHHGSASFRGLENVFQSEVFVRL